MRPRYKHFEDPKPGYVADWPDLPEWQKETDADIFEELARPALLRTVHDKTELVQQPSWPWAMW
ncbi:hypothetical protein [Streptomyces sp. NPDC004008]